MKKYRSLYILSALACCMYACGGETTSNGNGDCHCTEGQVCAGNGICYDNAACKDCKAGENCVSGTCYDADSACGKCNEDQVCVSDKCYNADSACAKCQEGQICSNDKCFDAKDPCAKCTSDQTCMNGKCLGKTDPCSKCKEDQVCKNETCYNADDPCLKCEDNESCHDGKCVDPNDQSCENCAAPNYCDNGECKNCVNSCENECCSDGQTCDVLDGKCVAACDTPEQKACGGFCCEIGETCDIDYGCVPVCKDGESTRCEGLVVACCDNATQECMKGECVPKCNGTRCGKDQELCCEGDTPVCDENVCKMSCSGTRCGDADEFCCDASTEVCLYKSCMPRGKSCTSSNDCSFDEFCEDSTKTCVKVDADPNACVVLPKPGEFKPILQWYWPEDLPNHKPAEYAGYVEPLDTPMAINLTDDNNDGVVDENDIPDVVFMARDSSLGEGSYYKLPGVLRVISGDDGHEIAWSEPIYYPAENVATGDIDGDKIPEIVVTRIAQSPNTVDILNVVPDASSATGYRLKLKASVETSYDTIAIGGQTDSSIADMDGDGIAEIITHAGVIEYKDGKLNWRCKRKMGDRPIPVDLDGDTIPEIVGYGIYDNMCNVLVDGTGKSREYWAVADLIPDSADASTTGELVPEIVRTYYTNKAPGIIEVLKLYKDKENKWSKSVVRTAEIPINYERAKKELNLDCNAKPNEYNCLAGGGAPVIADFNGDKRPDIGIASRWYYIVYSNNENSLDVLWADANIQDFTSAATGSSVFDFEGDGVAEVVYADEAYLHIYSGKGANKDEDGDGMNDAVRILDIPNTSGTLTEYPIIVDVDNDGSTEIVVASTYTKSSGFHGVRAFEDPDGRWVRTRRIWNQHNYYVTNIEENGTVPAKPETNWLNPKLNNFRQNVQPSGVYNAPNLVAGALSTDETACESGILKLVAKVENQGSLGIKAGLGVKFYAVVEVDGNSQTIAIGEAKVQTVMAPGSTATATLEWNQNVTINGVETEVKSPVKLFFVLDEPTTEKGYGEFIECVEDDNTLAAQDVKLCPAKFN